MDLPILKVFDVNLGLQQMLNPCQKI